MVDDMYGDYHQPTTSQVEYLTELYKQRGLPFFMPRNMKEASNLIRVLAESASSTTLEKQAFDIPGAPVSAHFSR